MYAHRATQEKLPRSKSSRSTPQFYNPSVSGPPALPVSGPSGSPVPPGVQPPESGLQPPVSGPPTPPAHPAFGVRSLRPLRCPASGVRCPICLISPISPIRLICPIKPIGLHHKNHKKKCYKIYKNRICVKIRTFLVTMRIFSY
jgi:hypothetical protein